MARPSYGRVQTLQAADPVPAELIGSHVVAEVADDTGS